MAQPISCAPPLLSLTTSSSLMSSLSNVSSTLPLPFFPWWRPSRPETTNPLPSWSLPSIAYFDRKPPSTGQSRDVPSFAHVILTPPPACATQWRDSTTSQLSYTQSGPDPVDSSDSSPVAGPSNPPSPAPARPAQSSPNHTSSIATQWFWVGQVGSQPSPKAIAEKTCEMVCYLWFSNTLGAHKSSPHRVRSARRSRASHSPSDPPVGLSDATTAALQFTPSSQFIEFMQKLLQTTQVSQSVIVLSLRYIYRLKEENHFTNGRAGSEFRVAVVALMMANKFVDDNTYTNKTWSEVSGIDLNEINKMEREFLLGVDYRLYVNTDTYKAWVNLLKGLVSVKERDEQQWQYSRRHTNGVPVLAPTPRHSASIINGQQQRARSSSPLPSLKASYPFTFVAPTYSNPFTSPPRPTEQPDPYMSARLGAKRPAVAAFSPPSASLPGPPAKRPISLDMSGLQSTAGPASAGSSYPLSAFANLSIDRSDAPTRLTPPRSKHPAEVPQTLAAPYSLQDRNLPTDPQNLYYYALASSPASAENDNRVRKALLRSYQPPYHPPSSGYPPAPPPQPMYVQSATASPVHPLPPYHYSHTHFSQFRPYDQPYYSNNNPNTYTSLAPVPLQDQDEDRTPYGYQHYQQQAEPEVCRVPVAPFANAGPPGVVHWGSQQAASPYTYSHV